MQGLRERFGEAATLRFEPLQNGALPAQHCPGLREAIRLALGVGFACPSNTTSQELP